MNQLGQVIPIKTTSDYGRHPPMGGKKCIQSDCTRRGQHVCLPCPNCLTYWYCSPEHMVLHWNSGHSIMCLRTLAPVQPIVSNFVSVARPPVIEPPRFSPSPAMMAAVNGRSSENPFAPTPVSTNARPSWVPPIPPPQLQRNETKSSPTWVPPSQLQRNGEERKMTRPSAMDVLNGLPVPDRSDLVYSPPTTIQELGRPFIPERSRPH